MSKHTPGPWTANVQTLHERAVVAEKRRGHGGERPGICALYGAKDAAETQANARLIAAAPELLAVCEKLAQRGAVIATTGLGDELNAAIAKAQGKAVTDA